MTAYFGFSYSTPQARIPETVPHNYYQGQRFEYDNRQHDTNPYNSFFFHFPDDPRAFNTPYDFSNYQKPNIYRNLNNHLFTDPYNTLWGSYMGVAYGNGPWGPIGNGQFIRGSGGMAGYGNLTNTLTGGLSNSLFAYTGRHGNFGYSADGGIGFLGNNNYANGTAFFSYGNQTPYYSSYNPSFTMNDLRSIVLNRKDTSNSNYNDYTGTVYGEALHWIEAFATVANNRTKPQYINYDSVGEFNKLAATNPSQIQSAFGKNVGAVPQLNEMTLAYGGLSGSPVWQDYVKHHIYGNHGGVHDILTPLKLPPVNPAPPFI